MLSITQNTIAESVQIMAKQGAKAPSNCVIELISLPACTIYIQVFWVQAATKLET